MEKQNGIERAIEIAGGLTALGKRVGVSRQAVEQWRNAGRVAPGSVIAVYDVTGVPLHELNAEVYPRDRIVVRPLRSTVWDATLKSLEQ